MIDTLATLLLALAAPAQEETPAPPAAIEDERPAPSDGEVRAAVDALRKARATKQPKREEAAIEDAAEVWHADVAREIAKSLGDDAETVRDGAIEALRWMEVPEALEALTKQWRRDRELRNDVVAAPAMLRAIGQHADPRTVDLLADDVFENTSAKAVQARIFALGRARDVESIDALMKMMVKVGDRSRGRRGGGGSGRSPHDANFRVALVVLTGIDLGRDASAWREWWKDHRKKFEVSSERPELPRDVERIWLRYWELADESEPEDGPRR
ncbi:MAG: hypothetical protein AAGA20_24275 [Planctomycetota bacterium]